jgi:hypothetical protein
MLTLNLFLIFLDYFSSLVVAQEGPGGDFTNDQLSWAGWGGGNSNRRFAEANVQINSTNIGTLSENCRVTFPKGISATPTVSETILLTNDIHIAH